MRKAAIACFAVLDYTKQRILAECSQVVEEEKTDMIFGEKTEEQKRVADARGKRTPQRTAGE